MKASSLYLALAGLLLLLVRSLPAEDEDLPPREPLCIFTGWFDLRDRDQDGDVDFLGMGALAEKNEIGMARGDGEGHLKGCTSFQVELPLDHTDFISVVFEDFNEDGALDVLATDPYEAEGRVLLYLADGDVFETVEAVGGIVHLGVILAEPSRPFLSTRTPVAMSPRKVPR
jgi:hypothetical protein